MKVLVAVKQVVDYRVRVRVKPDGSGVDIGQAQMSINPFDEVAIEQALCLKEAGVADEVIAVSVGEHSSQAVLRHALAMGADRAILVETDDAFGESLRTLFVSKVLKVMVERAYPAFVLRGK